jgi:hypothetical protein
MTFIKANYRADGNMVKSTGFSASRVFGLGGGIIPTKAQTMN